MYQLSINSRLFFIFCRLLILPVCLLYAVNALHAQSPVSSFLQGEKLFHEKRYFEAAQCYERFLSAEKKSKSRSIPLAPEKKVKGKTNLNAREEAVYHLAESYRLFNNYSKAEQWYREASSFSVKAYPECRYWYAVTLRANQHYTEAIGVIDTFLQTYNTMGPVLISADREFENLKFIMAQMARKDTNSFAIIPQQNQKGATSAYAMTMAGGDTVVFTAIHGDSVLQKDKQLLYTYTNELYESVENDQLMQQAKMISAPVQGRQNGLASFTKDGKKMFFTQWIKKAGGNISAIYMRERNDTGWTTAVKMDEPVNTAGYNSAQPFITADGKYLLFASDRPGGLGNYDIWFAAMDSSLHVLSVENMGAVINTAADEASPFYHTKSRTLIFASNGRIGMGGFDIYAARGNAGFTHWEAPVNPGMPVNSVRDDLYYTATDEDNLWNTGWISSDRASDCCLSLFYVTQNNRQTIQGAVVDCGTGQPLSDAKITVMDTRHKEKVMAAAKTDGTGHYAIQLRNASGIRILAEKQGYVPKDSSYTIYMETAHDTINNKIICMLSVADTVKKAVNNMLASLSQSATIGNFLYQQASLNGAAYTNLDSLAAVLEQYPGIKIQVGGYTDGNGTEAYNIRLAQARVDVCIRYLVKKGISVKRLVGKAFGKCCPLEPETIDGKDNPAARAKNRRVEYKVLEQ